MTKRSISETKRDIRFAAILLAVPFLFWFKAESIFFIGDDFSLVTEQLVSPYSIFTISAQFIMPTFKLFLAVIADLFGASPAAYHRAILMIHIANILMFYFILRRFTGNRYVSFISALCWGTLPQYAGSIYWITGAVHTVTLFFVFSALLLFFKWLDKDNIVFLISSLALLAAGFYSKETAIVFLFISFVYLIKDKRSLKAGLMKISPYIALFSAMIVFNYLIRTLAGIEVEGYYTLDPIIYFKYIMYYTLYNLFGFQFIASPLAAALFTLLLFLIIWRLRKTVYFHYLLLFLLFLLPFIFVGKAPQRYSYMTSLWLFPAAVIALGAYFVKFKDSILRFLVVMLGIVFLLVSAIRMTIEYRDYHFFAQMHREVCVASVDYLSKKAQEADVYLFFNNSSYSTLSIVNMKMQGFRKLWAMRGHGVNELIYLDDLFNFVINSDPALKKGLKDRGVHFRQTDFQTAIAAIEKGRYALLSYNRPGRLINWRLKPDILQKLKVDGKLPPNIIPYELIKLK